MISTSPMELRSSPEQFASGKSPDVATTASGDLGTETVRTRATLRERVARLFGAVAEGGTSRPSSLRGAMTFPVVLVESDGEYLLRAECPTIGEKDLKVRIDSNNVLTISGDHHGELVTHLHGQIISDRTYAGFYHAISLPVGIDRERIEAVFEGGILEIHIPKSVSLPAHMVALSEPVRRDGGAVHTAAE